MTDFDAIRGELRQTRARRDDADAALAVTRERLKQLAVRETRLRRSFDADDPAQVEARDGLARERAHLDAELDRLGQERDTAVATEAGLVEGFAVFTDPTTGIERLDDSIPILMMPIRLETRFKEAAPRDPGAAAVDQLWVRVYPDDCWVDTFDPALTTSEFADARNYWTSIWQAGGIEDQERGAWRTLVAAHGSGRSAWIVQSYQPGNLGEKPTKPVPQDVILTIVVDAALPAAEATAVAAFWTAVWRADGDAAATANARAALEAAVGAARADELVARTVPSNIDTPLATGFTKPDVAVTVAYLELAAADVKQQAWARPPRADVLPDRFVFIGYETAGDPDPVVVVGRPVPSPLILGPDPSAPEADQLQLDADGNLVIPDEMLWMADFERAVSVGMGIVVDLTPTQAQRGFDRVLVVGLRLGADAAAGEGRARGAAAAPLVPPHRHGRRPAGHADEQHRGRRLRAAARRPGRELRRPEGAAVPTRERLARQGRRPVARRVPRRRPGRLRPRACRRRARPGRGARDERRAVAGHARLLDGDHAVAGVRRRRRRGDAGLLRPLRRRRAARARRSGSASSPTASSRRRRSRA